MANQTQIKLKLGSGLIKTPLFTEQVALNLFILIQRLALTGGVSSEGPRLNALPAGATILMYGSSSVYGPGVEPHLSPPAFLQEITGYHVINAGVSGERILNVAGNPYNKDTDGISRLAGELDRYHPSLVILWHGRNDWFDGKDDIVVKAALLKMIDTAHERKVATLWERQNLAGLRTP